MRHPGIALERGLDPDAVGFVLLLQGRVESLGGRLEVRRAGDRGVLRTDRPCAQHDRLLGERGRRREQEHDAGRESDSLPDAYPPMCFLRSSFLDIRNDHPFPPTLCRSSAIWEN